MTSELSQILDELMGKNRNAAPDDKSQDVHWSDKDVCKHFLCGFCPAELFTNTRSDLGPCQKIHDEALKKSYQQSTRYMKMSYEQEFLHYLQQCMNDVERRIRRNHQRLQLNEEKNQKPAPPPNKDTEEQINLLTQRIEELLKKIEELGNDGNIEEAQGVMKLCDQLKEDRENLHNQQKGNVLDQFSVQEKQMEVCEVCGAFLIVGDAQSRVDDHLMGKQHMGYAKIKSHIEELKEQIRKKAEEPAVEEKKRPDEKQIDKSDDHHQDRDRDRDRDRHRSRDHDGCRSTDRHRDSRRHDDRRDSGRRRSRERDRDRGRGYHSRSRDDRDRRTSYRSRSRDRDRKHSRKHSRPRSRSRERKESKRSRRSESRDRKSEKRKDGGDDKDKESVNQNDASEKGEGNTINNVDEQNEKTTAEENNDGQENNNANGNQLHSSSADDKTNAVDGVNQQCSTEGDQ